MWFDGWSSLGNIALRGVVCFTGLVLLLRLGGKRTLTKMNAFDFIMTFTIGSTLASVITNEQLSIADGMTALAIIIGMQYIIAWCEVRSRTFQKVIKSQPTVLFKNGEFQSDQMHAERITQIEILAALRYKGFADPSQVDLVLMETNGSLSVIPKKDKKNDHDYGTMRVAQNYDQGRAKT
jgi:uncharacterized membrane protein YcaP (DUF421 family)